MRIALLHLRTDRPGASDYQYLVDALNTSAVAAVESLGWEADLVASGESPVQTSVEAVRSADAVILLGGEDVDPRLYNGATDYPGAGPADLRADAAHIAAVHTAVSLDKPLLGICRGLQLINVALGGTLVEHLPNVEHHRQSKPGFGSFIPNQLEFDHAAGRELRSAVGSATFRCSHHQAVDQPGKGLRVVARASDGTIEAVVHESAAITGVQWHPEHPEDGTAQLVGLLRMLERQASQHVAWAA